MVGKGWFKESRRHSMARRFGSAGGKMPSKFNASGVAYSQGVQYWRTPQGKVVRVGSSPLLRAYPKIMKQFNQPIDKNKIAGKSYGVENFSTQELEYGARNVKAKSMESLEKELKDVYPNYDVYVAPMSDGGYLAHIEKKKSDSVVVAKSEAKETPAQEEKKDDPFADWNKGKVAFSDLKKDDSVYNYSEADEVADVKQKENKTKVYFVKVGKGLEPKSYDNLSVEEINNLVRKGYAVSRVTTKGNKTQIFTFSPRTREEAIKQENRLFG